MKLCRKSFVYRVAYGWSKNPPNQIGLCDLFWQFSISLLIILPMLYSFGFLFGYKPRTNKECNLFVSYKKWPSISGYRILPIYLLVLAPYVYKFFIVPKQAFIVSVFMFSCAAVSFGLMWLTYLIIGLFQNSSINRLFKEFFKNKSGKICPTVEFIDTPN